MYNGSQINGDGSSWCREEEVVTAENYELFVASDTVGEHLPWWSWKSHGISFSKLSGNPVHAWRRYMRSAECASGYAAVTTTIRVRFDGRSTAHQRSLRSGA